MSILRFSYFLVVVCAFQYGTSALFIPRIFGVGGGAGAGGAGGGAGGAEVGADGAGGAGGNVDADTLAALQGLGKAGGAIMADTKKNLIGVTGSGLDLAAALARKKAAFMDAAGDGISNAIAKAGQSGTRLLADIPKTLFRADGTFLRKFADATTNAKGAIQGLEQQSLNPLDNPAIRGAVDQGVAKAKGLVNEALETGAELGAAAKADGEALVNGFHDGAAEAKAGIGGAGGAGFSIGV